MKVRDRIRLKIRNYPMRIRWALFSLLLSICILSLKAWAYALTGSVALQSDALESIVNVVAAIFAVFSIVYAEQPADDDHPYGHGKIEYFSAAFEGGLVSFAAFVMIYEGFHSFGHHKPLMTLDVGLMISAIAGLLNGSLGILLIRAGRNHKSETLEADGHHVLSDFWTTVGVLLGLFLVKMTGLNYLDGMIAILMGLLLMRTGWKIASRSFNALLDKESPELLNRLLEAMNACRHPAVIAAHGLRTLRSGRFVHVDLHIVVPEYLEVIQAHELLEAFEARVIKNAKIEGEFHSHMDPCRKKYCYVCSVENCPIRIEEWDRKQIQWTLAELQIPEAHY